MYDHALHCERKFYRQCYLQTFSTGETLKSHAMITLKLMVNK